MLIKSCLANNTLIRNPWEKDPLKFQYISISRNCVHQITSQFHSCSWGILSTFDLFMQICMNSWKRHLLIPIQLRFLLSHWMHRCQGQCQRKARFGTSGRSNSTLTMMKVFLTCVYQTLLYCMTLPRKVQDMLGELGLSNIVWCGRIDLYTEHARLFVLVISSLWCCLQFGIEQNSCPFPLDWKVQGCFSCGMAKLKL